MRSFVSSRWLGSILLITGIQGISPSTFATHKQKFDLQVEQDLIFSNSITRETKKQFWTYYDIVEENKILCKKNEELEKKLPLYPLPHKSREKKFPIGKTSYSFKSIRKRPKLMDAMDDKIPILPTEIRNLILERAFYDRVVTIRTPEDLIALDLLYGDALLYNRYPNRTFLKKLTNRNPLRFRHKTLRFVGAHWFKPNLLETILCNPLLWKRFEDLEIVHDRSLHKFPQFQISDIIQQPLPCQKLTFSAVGSSKLAFSFSPSQYYECSNLKDLTFKNIHLGAFFLEEIPQISSNLRCLTFDHVGGYIDNPSINAFYENFLNPMALTFIDSPMMTTAFLSRLMNLISKDLKQKKFSKINGLHIQNCSINFTKFIQIVGPFLDHLPIDTIELSSSLAKMTPSKGNLRRDQLHHWVRLDLKSAGHSKVSFTGFATKLAFPLAEMFRHLTKNVKTLKVAGTFTDLDLETFWKHEIKNFISLEQLDFSYSRGTRKAYHSFLETALNHPFFHHLSITKVFPSTLPLLTPSIQTKQLSALELSSLQVSSFLTPFDLVPLKKQGLNTFSLKFSKKPTQGYINALLSAGIQVEWEE